MTTTAYLTDDDFAGRTIMVPAAVERLQGVSFERPVADGLDGDATPESPFGVVRYEGNVVSVEFYPDNALAADAVNYATISVFKRAANGTQTLIASVDTSTQGWTNGVPVVFTIAAAPVLVRETLTYTIAKHGTGVVIPTGRFFVKLSANFLTVRLLANTGMINARLRKRYPNPFTSPIPETVLTWLTDLTTRDAFNRLGRNPTIAEDAVAIDDPAKKAEDQLTEAANSQTALFDLPASEGVNGTGVAAGGPLGYSETSPYVAFDIQRDTARIEDESRSGSGDVE